MRRPIAVASTTANVALAVIAAAALAVGAASGSVHAHTETDLVAVSAGSEAVVTLRPTHGCGDSSTVSVRLRAPVEGAAADPVDGWQASATPDGAGNTVLEWSGGVLPADATGAFPVRFTVPDEPGALLLFPAVQRCENGDELAWINGDPTAEYPAPRVLVLAAGSQAAATIDDVPADAPGREQLVAIVDVDAPSAATTTVPPSTVATATAPTTAATTAPTTPATTPAGVATTAGDVATTPGGTDVTAAVDGDGDDATSPLVVVVGLVVAAVVVAAVVLSRRTRRP